MNGQEKCDEITGDVGRIYTAKFWMYDTYTATRWNLDPVRKPWQSPYAVFSGNPIMNIDPLGNDDDWFEKQDDKGKGTGAYAWSPDTKGTKTNEDGFEGTWKNVGDNRTIVNNGTTMTMNQDKVTSFTHNNTPEAKGNFFTNDNSSGFSKAEGNGYLGWGVSYMSATLAAGGIGGSFDFGSVFDSKGGHSNYFSYGNAFGLEASAGAGGFVAFAPKGNFKVSDFAGGSVSVSGNYAFLSIGAFTNSSNSAGSDGTGQDNLRGDYFGIKISVGAGIGGSVQNMNTKLTPILKVPIIMRGR